MDNTTTITPPTLASPTPTATPQLPAQQQKHVDKIKERITENKKIIKKKKEKSTGEGKHPSSARSCLFSSLYRNSMVGQFGCVCVWWWVVGGG